MAFDPGVAGGLSPDPRGWTLRAIGALTAWADAPEDAREFPLLVEYLAAEALDTQKLLELLVGYSTLSAHLLILLERHTQASRSEILQQLARSYALGG